MVDRIGDGALAREAILAAMKAQARQTDGVGPAAPRLAEPSAPAGGPARADRPASFGERLAQGIEEVSAELRGAERLPEELVTGKVESFHEVAVQLKQADLSFRFALEIRNKLVDAYREVMRMNV